MNGKPIRRQKTLNASTGKSGAMTVVINDTNLETLLYEWTDPSTQGSVWYRGHADACYKLIPSLMRNPKYENLVKKYFDKTRQVMPSDLERLLLNRFRQFASTKGRSELYSNPSEMNVIDWLCAAQHYGVPTRLLDWTTNPLVALYFACESSPETDGAIWRMNLKPRDSIANLWIDLNDSYQDNEAQMHVMYADTHGQPLLITPPHHVARIGAQASRFTLTTNCDDTGPFGASTEWRPWLSLTCTRITAEVKQQIIKKLEIYDIHAGSLFPGMDGYAAYISQT